MRSGFARVPIPAPARQRAQNKTMPAPIRGWIVNENLSRPQPGGALVLENWRPTQTGIQLRGGSKRHATVGVSPVEAIMTYASSGLQKMFAASGASIYEVSAPASPTVPPSAAVSGLTSAAFSYVNFATVGGSYLVAVNGSDNLQLYDGTVWTPITGVSTPIAITATGLNTNRFSHVWTYRNRLFFVDKGTKRAWYLPVDSVGGAASDFSLNGVFQMGGSLLFGGNWSQDAGDGMDDKCVFVSDQGEIAIYEGSNPSDADEWRLVGLYQIGRPLGKNAIMKAGGDLLIATQEGLVPVSQAIAKDRAALSLASVSRPIAPEWAKEATARNLAWDVLKWPAKKIAIVAAPASTADDKMCLIVHLETGAWSKYTGWDTRSLGLYNERAYFGTSNGTIMLAENGGSDDGEPYVAVAVSLFDSFGLQGAQKTIQMARAAFLATTPFDPVLSASFDYQVDLPAAPPSVPDTLNADAWDQGVWDTARWDGSSAQIITTQWGSVGLSGFAVAWQIQVTCGATATPDAELVAIDFTFETGGLVV